MTFHLYLTAKFIAKKLQNLFILLFYFNYDMNSNFKFDPSNSFKTKSFWSLMSNGMVVKDYEKWSPQKCRDTYFCSINLNETVLKKSLVRSNLLNSY